MVTEMRRGKRQSRLRLRPTASMAIGAFLRRRLVEQDYDVVHRAPIHMASLTRHVLMAAFQRKCGFLMIEQGRAPFVCVVTRGALQRFRTELVSVRVLMAPPAIGGSFSEAHMEHGSF